MAENKRILVIGGGIAGLTAAQALSRMETDVLLVERGPFLGGHAANLTCKATVRCLKCNGCLFHDRLRAFAEEGGIDIRLMSEIENIERKKDGFNVSIRSGPTLIDPEKCTDCGLCFEKCPEAGKGAIIMAPSHHLHPFYAFDPAKCTCLQDKEIGIYQSICPENAINLTAKEEWHRVKVSGVIIATGYQPFDPREIKRFNFERFGNMITAMDLEKILRQKGDILRPTDDAHPESIAFVQCVGSRDSQLNHEYCSRVCCGYALRMALRINHDHPEIRITMFYMDIQNFGKEFDLIYREAGEKIRLIRGLPGDFYAGNNDGIAIGYYDENTKGTTSDNFDLVILSVGMVPQGSNTFFKDMLGLTLNDDGFLSFSEENMDRSVITAGSAAGPMDISESISQGKMAALEMAKCLDL